MFRIVYKSHSTRLFYLCIVLSTFQNRMSHETRLFREWSVFITFTPPYKIYITQDSIVSISLILVSITFPEKYKDDSYKPYLSKHKEIL